jgi:hypothetical protein
VTGDVDERVLVENRVLGQHPIERSAELRGVLGRPAAVDPAREDRRGDTVPDGDAAHALADLDDLAGTVGDWDNVRLDRQRIPAAQDHQLAEAERARPDRMATSPARGRRVSCSRTVSPSISAPRFAW